MKKKLTSVLAVLMVMLTVISFSSVSAFAEDAEQTNKITVTFSLMGDYLHGSNGTHYGFYNWIEPEEVQADSDATVAEIFMSVLDAKGFTYEGAPSYISSVTTPGGCTLGEFVNGSGSGWMYAVNNTLPMVGASAYKPKNGDTITWFYVDNWGSDPRLSSNLYVPEITVNNLPSQWSQYHANGDVLNNSVADVEETAANFQFQLKESTDWSTGVSDPLIINNNIYIVAGDLLYVLDSTGEPVNGTALFGSIGYTSRLVYANGIIVVPFADGSLQALTAETLETLWTTPAVKVANSEGTEESQQALTTITYDDGYIYFGTSCAGFSSTTSGMFRCVELLTGTTVWQYDNNNSGYYWSGAAVKGNAIIFGGDDGVLNSINKKTGEVIDRLNEDTNGIRSTIVIDNSKAYYTTRDGNINSVEILSDGSFGEFKSANFAKSSTCTPTVIGDTIVVGGAAADYTGVLVEIDKETLQVKHTASAVADVKSAPVVNVVGNNTYVIFTANKTPGGLYIHKLGTDVAEELYIPEGSAQNYCMASPVMDENGNIYYTNDSGYLLSVAFAPKEESQPIMGDVNGDGSVTTIDAVLIQRQILGLVVFSEEQQKCADMNNDGRISITDAVMVLRKVMQLS